MVMIRCAALGCLLLPAAGAVAQSIDEARSAYEEGRFPEAAELGAAIRLDPRLVEARLALGGWHAVGRAARLPIGDACDRFVRGLVLEAIAKLESG